MTCFHGYLFTEQAQFIHHWWFLQTTKCFSLMRVLQNTVSLQHTPIIPLAKYCFTTTYTNYSTCKILFHYSIYQSFLWQTLYQLLFLSQTLHSAKYSSNTYTKHSNGRYFTSTQKLYSASTVTKHTASTLMIHFYFTLGSSVNNYNSSLMRSTDNKVCHLAW